MFFTFKDVVEIRIVIIGKLQIESMVKKNMIFVFGLLNRS